MKTLEDVAAAINSGALPGVKGQAWVKDGLVVISPCVPTEPPTPTPATMLGEAREFLRRAETILGRLREGSVAVPRLLVMADEAASNAASWVEDVIVMEREREAASGMAESSRQADEQRRLWVQRHVKRDSCWQCDNPLGTGPDACLTCAAKRAEDAAGPGSASRAAAHVHYEVLKRAEGRLRAPVCRKCDLSAYGSMCSCSQPRDPAPSPAHMCALCSRPFPEHDMTNSIVRCPEKRDPSPGVGS